ncbi:hypothetical protein Anapl_14891 [Anas platyrhynchos]|uniref:Uncharacterized protein n=1 Tax=Anas platyrhynchos TaxID=8839 RepID=R0L2U7_ANAPL|nr:hypothetical protein Anapl_14891 [Anas platyrhynchos]
MRGWDSRRAMKKAELLTRACSAAAPPKALLKRVAAIQHCFKTRELTGKGCLLLATNRGACCLQQEALAPIPTMAVAFDPPGQPQHCIGSSTAFAKASRKRAAGAGSLSASLHFLPFICFLPQRTSIKI